VDNGNRRPIFIGAGANLPHPSYASPRETLQAALLELDRRQAHVLRYSHWYRTAPVPTSDQPWYVNVVAEIATSLGADELLAVLHEVEDLFGRVRSVPNAARLIDLDLLDYRGEICASGSLAGDAATSPDDRSGLRAAALGRSRAGLATSRLGRLHPGSPESPPSRPDRRALRARRLAFWAGTGITRRFQEI